MAIVANAVEFPGFVRVLRTASVSQIVTSIAAILLLRWITRGIYRVYFHQLSKFPGPKFAAFTRLPQLKAVYSGTEHLRMAQLHEEYGDIVRYSPDEISVRNPQAWRDIYGYGSKGTPGSAPPKYWAKYGTAANGASSLVNVQSPFEHGRMRRIFNPAFSDRALKQQEPLFTKYVNQMVQVVRDGISKDPNHKFDMVRLFNFTTFDVMGDLTFGEPLHMLDKNDYDPWVAVIFTSIKIATKLSVLGYYPLISQIVKVVLGPAISKKRMEHFNHAVTRVTKRLEKGRETEGVDLWDYVLSQDEGRGLSRPEMDANSSLFMMAGTETTATVLSGFTYLLLSNPDVKQKLVEEIRGAFSSSDDMSMEAIATLPYLNACIKETLRRYPPVVAGLPHLTPSDGSTICGQFVPPGTVVSTPHLAMYTSSKFFKDPLEFHPERWLGDERYADDNRAALQPFSVGARDCLGKNMAQHEMRLIAAKMLYNFDLELCPESNGWSDQNTYMLWEKHPLMVKLSPAVSS
ncbi:cytochrome P450 [Dendryphion nanum]|uniref:Cytochrome P450 n=1 Tax=Dendryphion nanum TaxID=256645 RepID=A0A9P9J2C2_9PLEO|nr:cytochrome P450 [Dendryphion nanum]